MTIHLYNLTMLSIIILLITTDQQSNGLAHISKSPDQSIIYTEDLNFEPFQAFLFFNKSMCTIISTAYNYNRTTLLIIGILLFSVSVILFCHWHGLYQVKLLRTLFFNH